jgi:hypothetical protein
VTVGAVRGLLCLTDGGLGELFGSDIEGEVAIQHKFLLQWMVA